jgi:2-polyprenyl-6-methoxyphenol hydroxylase-like FAD-dependent oxidoreductase
VAGERVVVVGGGFGGLTAALALARAGAEVVLLERDPLPEPGSADDAFDLERPGATQVHQTHGFLARIVVLLRDRFPDLLDALLATGCTTMSPTAALGEPRAGDEDLAVLIVRRSTFEWVLRRAVAAEPAVEVRGGAGVAGLRARPNGAHPAVAAVALEDGSELTADFVVAAAGRRADVAGWLEPLGVGVPETVHQSGLVYLTRWYRTAEGIAAPPAPKAGGDLEFLKYLVVPGDGAMLSATLAVPTDDRSLRRALSDPARFDRACRMLPGPDEWFGGLDLEPVGEVRPMGGLLNRIRRFTAEDGTPEVLNFHVLGDAHTCTNPLYGRGCTLALLQAVRLAEAVADGADPIERGRRYEEACRREVAPWWRHAVETDRSGADPGIDEGDRALRDRLRALNAASQTDPVVGRAMTRLWNLLALPRDLEADEEFAARAAAIMGDPVNYPVPERLGPSRDVLLEALGV